MFDYNACLGERGVLGLCHVEKLPFFKGLEAHSLAQNKKAVRSSCYERFVWVSDFALINAKNYKQN